MSTFAGSRQRVCGGICFVVDGRRFLLSGELMRNLERCSSLQKSSCGYIKLSASPGGGIQGECVVMGEDVGDLPLE